MADKKLIASATLIASGAYLLWKSGKSKEETKTTEETTPQASVALPTSETTDSTKETTETTTETSSETSVETTTQETTPTEELDFEKWGERIAEYSILTITDANKDTYLKSFEAGYGTMQYLVLDKDYDLVSFETSNNAEINLSGIKPSDSLGSFFNSQRIVLVGGRAPYYSNVRLSQEGANRHESYSFSNYIYSYMGQPCESKQAFYEFMYYNGAWFSKSY